MFKQINKRLNFNIFLQMFVLFTPLVQAAQMAIVIDDVGYRIKEDSRNLSLTQGGKRGDYSCCTLCNRTGKGRL